MADPRIGRTAIGSLPVASTGCAPTVDVLGVYFPGWLVCAVAGGLVAYLLVWWLGRRRDARNLADSGLFFVSVSLGMALAFWWIFFSAF
jgi:hypothetical protein